ncbi:ATP-binding protein [Oceaniglobus roseus]|uniref:ATP-binding protein n=1 Tax=Oceaniglobus roseus TaxID=1737570 RepID=UPI000C7F66A2|nr:ATP-binding protein [Kandeliimicrobium roseum]
MRVDPHKRPLPARRPGTRGRSVELRMVFSCTPLGVRGALARILAGLGAMELSADDSSTVELVLAEVLNNVSEHAYRDDPEGLIEVQLTQTRAGLGCRVIDSGHALPGCRLPPLRVPDPDRPLCDQPEGGFGWYLIHRLTRDLAYLRDGGRNILSFRIDVDQSLRRN